MTDEAQPVGAARRAADDDAPTTVLPAIANQGGARRSVTPDWDDDLDDDPDDGWDDEATSQKAASAAGTFPASEPPATGSPTPHWVSSPTASSSTSSSESPAGGAAAGTPTWRPVGGARPAGGELPASVVPPPNASPTAPGPSSETPDSHAAFRPPLDDADTVVIKRGELASLHVMPAAVPGLESPGGLPEDGSAAGPDSHLDPGTEPEPPAAGAPQDLDHRPGIVSAAADDAHGASQPGSGTVGGSRDLPEAPEPKGLPRWLVPAVAVAVVAVLVVVWATWLNRAPQPIAGSSSASAPSSSVVAALNESSLVGVADAALAIPANWTVDSTTSPVPDSLAGPLCYAQAPGLPAAAASFQRSLSAAPATLVHRADAYASVADATSVAAVRSTQLGRCATVPVFLSSGAAITGLGDEAVAVTAVIQNQTPSYHTVLLVRTGNVVEIIDIAQPGGPVAFDKVVATAATVVGKHCAGSGGACVSSPKITAGPPPSGGVAGWLTVSDLPRITPGMGRWTVSEPSTTIRVIGSQCENVSLATAPGPNQRRQRTFLLTEDTVPKGFGLDQLLLDFDTPEAAAAFSKSLVDNIESCTSRVPTAQLGAVGTFAGNGVAGEPISGYWRTVVQPTSASSSAMFRVSVSVVGKRVVYLLLTPTATYDMSNDAWAAVGLRAAQRATQQA